MAAPPPYHEAFWLGTVTVEPLLFVGLIVIAAQALPRTQRGRPRRERWAATVLYLGAGVTAAGTSAVTLGGLRHLARESDAGGAWGTHTTILWVFATLAMTLLVTLLAAPTRPRRHKRAPRRVPPKSRRAIPASPPRPRQRRGWFHLR